MTNTSNNESEIYDGPTDEQLEPPKAKQLRKRKSSRTVNVGAERDVPKKTRRDDVEQPRPSHADSAEVVHISSQVEDTPRNASGYDSGDNPHDETMDPMIPTEKPTKHRNTGTRKATEASKNIGHDYLDMRADDKKASETLVGQKSPIPCPTSEAQVPYRGKQLLVTDLSTSSRHNSTDTIYPAAKTASNVAGGFESPQSKTFAQVEAAGEDENPRSGSKAKNKQLPHDGVDMADNLPAKEQYPSSDTKDEEKSVTLAQLGHECDPGNDNYRLTVGKDIFTYKRANGADAYFFPCPLCKINILSD